MHVAVVVSSLLKEHRWAIDLILALYTAVTSTEPEATLLNLYVYVCAHMHLIYTFLMCLCPNQRII